MSRVELRGPDVERAHEVLTPGAMAFVARLQRQFGKRRDELLEVRARRSADVTRTGRLEFLPETAAVREGEWTVAPAPPDLLDRRVEISSPTEPKMAVNALNSGANVWLADLEDANTPHWANVVGGQVHLRDAVRNELAFTAADGMEYRVRDDGGAAVIVVRPRGWHLDEWHVLVDGGPCAAALLDFGLYFFHNAAELLERGSGPYFYLPKLESHLEARLWNDVFAFAQEDLGIPQGSVRATVLIETIPAAFEMHEILYELREHASGLNAGRWDYLFSMIKYFRDAGADFVLPDRNAVTMTAPFMRAYTELLVRTCHVRGAYAMGGMAAFIPSRSDPQVNERALAMVREDKKREADDGFDGSWVAHPDLVPVCREVFDGALGAGAGATGGARTNQLDRRREEVSVSASDLLDVASTPGSSTLDGLRSNVCVALQYLAAWLGGNGAAAINNLMEDTATAEIARAQIWQWTRQRVILDGGTVATPRLVRKVLDAELAAIRSAQGHEFDEERYEQARILFEQVALAKQFTDFLTVPAYDLID